MTPDPDPTPDERRLLAVIDDLKVKRFRCTDPAERGLVQEQIYILNEQIVTLRRQARERK